MEETYKLKLESVGYEVIELQHLDPHFRTKTFIKKLDGTLSGFYDELWMIPQSLNAGDEVSTYVTEVPSQARNTDSYDVHAATYSLEEGELGFWAIVLFLIFIGIVMGILFMKAFFGDKWNTPPCGEKGSIIDITECVKMIVYPDCSGVMYDACQKEIIDHFDPPELPPDWTKGAMWLAVGLVAVAAILIIPKLIPRKQQQYYPPPPRYYPPQHTRAPGIDYVE